MQSFQQQIGDYIIYFNKLIGQGKYGKVYECYSAIPSEKYTLLCAKVLSCFEPKKAKTEEKILKLLIEQAEFNAHVVSVKKVINIEEQKQLVIIMERCQESLQQEMNRKKQYTSEEVREILRQLLIGYAPLEKQNIIHRDIKPENILIGSLQAQRIYKLSDFGVGKILKQIDQHVTRTGTPIYAAPEINCFLSDSELSDDLKKLKYGKSPVDMYSIGVILYQLIYGCLPFQPDPLSLMNFLKNLKTSEFKAPQFPNCDIALLKTIEGLIKYYPSQRINYETLYQQYTQKKRSSMMILKPKFQTSQAPMNPYLQQFKELMQNYIEMQTQIGQSNEVLQVMQQAVACANDSVSFKQKVLELRQLFKFDQNKFYSEYLIKFFFALRFYTDEWTQPFDPLTLTIIQMRDFLIQYGL